jgi:hypothetical protein
MRKWEDVFSSYGDEFIKCVKNNKAAYDNIEEEDSKDIESCVNYAAETGCNAAFAKYYFTFMRNWKEKIKSNAEKLETRLKKRGFSISKIHIYKYWRYMDNSSQKDDSIYQFFEYNNRLLDRDAFIQLGFYLGYNSQKTNEMLRCFSLRELYALDIIDVITEFYLNSNAKIRKKGDELIDSVYAKHKKCREAIKDYISKLNNRNSLKFDKEYGKPVLAENKGKLMLSNKQILDEDYIYYYDKLIESKNGIDYITSAFADEEKQKGMKDEKAFFTYLDNNLEYFRQIYYTYYKMTAKFLFDNDSFKKNLSYSPVIFSKSVSYDDMNKVESEMNPEIREKYTKLEKKRQEGKKVSLNAVAEMVNYILNIFDPALGSDYHPDSTSASKLKNKLQGRKTENEKAYYQEDLKKNTVIWFAIATGHENDIGEYLIHTGFWNDDYTSKDMWDDKEVKNMDPTDLILQYSVRLREELISSWTEKKKQRGIRVDEMIFKQELREVFPFNKLMGMVCRDILFSTVYMEGVLDENMLPKKLKKFERKIRENQIDELCDTLIIPIYKSNVFWTDAVRKIYKKTEKNQ